MSSIVKKKDCMLEALEPLNNVTPSETAIAMETMATIHAVALDAFLYFYSQTTLILRGTRRHFRHHRHHSSLSPDGLALVTHMVSTSSGPIVVERENIRISSKLIAIIIFILIFPPTHLRVSPNGLNTIRAHRS
jgi:hypothetical protein